MQPRRRRSASRPPGGLEASVSRVVLEPDRCKACLLCLEACPQGVLGPGRAMNARGFFSIRIAQPGLCLGCGLCCVACPDTALAVERSGAAYQLL
jgi:2-oxoglutarate ferredoxin oxidoreductase subunit delta